MAGAAGVRKARNCVADGAEVEALSLPEDRMRVGNGDQQISVCVKGEIVHRRGAKAIQQRLKTPSAVITAERSAKCTNVDRAAPIHVDLADGPEKARIT